MQISFSQIESVNIKTKAYFFYRLRRINEIFILWIKYWYTFIQGGLYKKKNKKNRYYVSVKNNLRRFSLNALDSEINRSQFEKKISQSRLYSNLDYNVLFQDVWRPYRCDIYGLKLKLAVNLINPSIEIKVSVYCATHISFLNHQVIWPKP